MSNRTYYGRTPATIIRAAQALRRARPNLSPAQCVTICRRAVREQAEQARGATLTARMRAVIGKR